MVTKEELINLVTRNDFKDYMLSLTKEEVEELLGKTLAKMVGYDQKNIHHSYDLFEHTLRVVENVNTENLDAEEIINLKIAALYHDIGKIDVAVYNEEKKQNSYPLHPIKSAQIAREELKQICFDDNSINKICLLIIHHDDFLHYRLDLPEYMKNHEIIREISKNTVAEKMIENDFMFEKMNLDKTQIRFICSYLSNGEEPSFIDKIGIKEINVDIESIIVKMQEEEYINDRKLSLKDYELLLRIIKADSMSKRDIYVKDGIVIHSMNENLKAHKILEDVIYEAYEHKENLKLKFEILSLLKKNTILNKKLEDSKILLEEYSRLYSARKNNK